MELFGEWKDIRTILELQMNIKHPISNMETYPYPWGGRHEVGWGGGESLIGIFPY